MSLSNDESLQGDEGIDLPFDPETDVFWFYLVECEIKACTAEFYLNDIPLALNSPELGYFFAQPVNQCLIDGPNEMAFIVKPGSCPSQALSGPPEGKTEDEAYVGGLQSVTMRLCRYPFGAVVGGPDQQILHTLTWPQEIHEDTHEYPLRMALPFTRATDTGPWQWETLPKLTLDDATCASILSFLTELRASMEAKDPELFLAAAAPRFDELAKAYEDPPYKKRNAFRRMVEEIDGMQPLNPDDFDLRLAAGGRLVECVKADWSPILRGLPDADGNEDQYDVFIGRPDGQWRIFR